MSKRVPVLTAAAVTVAILAAPAPAGAAVAADRLRPVGLESFNSCRELVRYGVTHLRRYARPYGRGPMPVSVEDRASGGSGAAPSFSTTNVQEEGIDEPDIVKTDGRRVLALARGGLHAVDVTGDEPVRLGSLDLPQDAWDAQLFLQGDRILLIWTAYQRTREVTTLAEVDATDPAAMRIVRTYTIDGAVLGARMTGTTARVVVRSLPRPIALPAARRERHRATRWLPRAVMHDRTAGTREAGPAVGCDEVRRARAFSGLELVTVVTVDLAGGLVVTDTDTLMTGAETMYASTGGLYLATARWLRPDRRTLPPGYGTAIHRFDTTQPIATTYAGSGVVPGTLLNQFALSEQDGVLRVASTDAPEWWADTGEDEPASESFVTTLRPDPATGDLHQLGGVGGLGRGERIHAVRFIGDVGYVVTFRETDPLYAVDLSDPAVPRVAGELKIEGYSAYLHPAGEGRLIGVGQDATARGRRLGTQVSLFDVSDPSAPKRLAHLRLGDDGSWSEVEWDHHAFLWWPETSLAVIPVMRWGEADEAPEAGAIGLRVTPDAIEQIGRAEHPAHQWDSQVRRSLVVGGRLYTLSNRGLLTSTLDALQRRHWLPLR